MALQTVLSALREIILDRIPLPDALEEREKFLMSRYPSMSTVEVQDLAKISPAKFQTYTHSIFSKERSVLRSKYPIVFELASFHWKRAYKEKLDTIELVHDLHKKRPWKSTQVTTLVENFALYIKQDRRDLITISPELGDMVELEHCSYLLRRAQSDQVTPRDAIALSDILQLTVEEMLDLSFWVPTLVIGKRFAFDVVEYTWAYYADGERLPGFPAEQCETFSIGARNFNNVPRWVKCSDGVYEFFRNVPRARFHYMSSLAEAFVDERPGEDEEKVLKEFLELVRDLHHSGAIVIQKRQ